MWLGSKIFLFAWLTGQKKSWAWMWIDRERGRFSASADLRVFERGWIWVYDLESLWEILCLHSFNHFNNRRDNNQMRGPANDPWHDFEKALSRSWRFLMKNFSSSASSTKFLSCREFRYDQLKDLCLGDVIWRWQEITKKKQNLP